MLALLLATAAALIWGTGDYSGGKASQRAGALQVTVLSQLLSLPILVGCVALTAGATPRPTDIGWGAAAGVAGFIGIVLLYRGLAAGAMAIFAPVTAVTAAVVPLAVGLIFDEPPGGLALTGVGCAIVAIALMSLAPQSPAARAVVDGKLIRLALASGAMFGAFFALLGQASSDTGLWPLVGVRTGSLALGLALVARSGLSLRLRGPALRWTAIAGVFDIAANALYLLAAQRGTLSIVAPIAALYPASTVILALAIDRERIRPAQAVGLGLAATALVLVAS